MDEKHSVYTSGSGPITLYGTDRNVPLSFPSRESCGFYLLFHAQGFPLIHCKKADAMNEKITVNELISRMIVEMRRLGYSEETIWRVYYPKLGQISTYYRKTGNIFIVWIPRQNIPSLRKTALKTYKSRQIQKPFRIRHFRTIYFAGRQSD